MAGRLCIYLVFVIFYVNLINASSNRDQRSALLSKLLDKFRQPIIVVVSADQKPEASELYQVPIEGMEKNEPESTSELNLEDYDEMAQRESVKIIHDFVKSPDKEDDDNQTLKLKNSLRQGLIARCGKVNSCVNRCVKKRKVKYIKVCYEYCDADSLCDPEPVCNYPVCPPRWGKTMPPKWRL